MMSLKAAAEPGADVETLGTIWQANAEGREVAASVNTDDVFWQVDGLAVGLRHLEQATTGVDLIGFEQRIADGIALSCQEGEAHRATDDQGIDDAQQRLDDTQLVGDLRPTEHCDEWMLGLLAQAQQHLDFLLQQQTHRRRQGERRADDGCVRTVTRAERVVDVRVDAVDQRCDERGIVGLFARIESQVLE